MILGEMPAHLDMKEAIFRPAVYGVYIENNQVALERHAETGLYYPPGRILEDYETPTQVVRQHFSHLTSMMPLLGPMLSLEDQYRIDQGGRAWHLSVIYYALDRPMSSSMILIEMSGLAWVFLNDLERSQMQFGYDAVQAGRRWMS